MSHSYLGDLSIESLTHKQTRILWNPNVDFGIIMEWFWLEESLKII